MMLMEAASDFDNTSFKSMISVHRGYIYCYDSSRKAACFKWGRGKNPKVLLLITSAEVVVITPVYGVHFHRKYADLSKYVFSEAKNPPTCFVIGIGIPYHSLV